MTKKTLLLLLFVFSSLTIFSQTDTSSTFNKHHFWVNTGIGFSQPLYINSDFIGLSYLLNNKYAFQANYFRLTSSPKENTLHNLNSLILTFGINKSISRTNSFIFSAGLSYGQGTYYGQDTAKKVNYNWGAMLYFPFGLQPQKYIETPYEYFGLYISGQYLLRTRFYGLGMKIYCNIHRKIDYGITISHNLGSINKKRIKKQRTVNTIQN